MNVLVTGANGFLGRHVVTALVQQGHSVQALVRPASPADLRLGEGPINLVRGDLRSTSTNELESMFAGVDALVHLAAAVKGDDEAQFRGTAVGTERLLDAMARTATRRLVLASSFSVYDWSRARGVLREASPFLSGTRHYERDGYAIAKVAQETHTRRAAARHGWDLTVLRPGFIWGRGNADFAALGQRIGPFRLVFAPFGRIPITHVENCADLFAKVVDDPRAFGRTFNVVDGDSARVLPHLLEFRRQTGEKGPILPVPYLVGYWTTRLAQATSRLIFRGKGKLPSLLVPLRFEARFKPLRFPNALAREVLGWSPPLNHQECVRRTYVRSPTHHPRSA